MAARRTPGWGDVHDMEPPAPEQVELLGLSVVVTVLERMTEPERARTLNWLVDKYGPKISMGEGDQP